MAKEAAPAFQFYAAEFLADENVRLMEVTEVGCYTMLLASCWIEGSIPADPEKMTALCKGVKPTKLVIDCFDYPSKNESRLMHPRLEVERNKQAKWRKKCAKGGKQSAHKRKHKKELSSEQGSLTTVPRVVEGYCNTSSSSSSSIVNIKNILTTVVRKWNKTEGVIPIRKVEDKRLRTLKTRLKQKDWPWEEALNKFPLECFKGGNGWQPNFDWFIRPDTVNNILEGKYDWSKDSKHTKTAEELGLLPEVNDE